jgi:hypothetical protein
MTPAELLLRDGVPPSLLIDLWDPEGMVVALTAELLPTDVATAPAPVERNRSLRTA